MWSVKKKEGDDTSLFVIKESVLPGFAEAGERRSWHTMVMKGHHSFCEVILWACGSCALSEFRGINSTIMRTKEDADTFIQFLKTGPFNSIDGWAHKIFVFVPGQRWGIGGDGSEGWKYFLTQCKAISSFKNHAHGGHLLTLFQLDVS